MKYTSTENSNNDDRYELLPKSNTILDLLKHEVNTTIGADKTLKRLERTLMHPEILKNLTFDQMVQLMDRVMRRQEKSHAFIIDFYRVTSKSQEIQNTLKQYTMMGAHDEQKSGSGDLVSSESEEAIKQKLLSKLDVILREEEDVLNEG